MKIWRSKNLRHLLSTGWYISACLVVLTLVIPTTAIGESKIQSISHDAVFELYSDPLVADLEWDLNLDGYMIVPDIGASAFSGPHQVIAFDVEPVEMGDTINSSKLLQTSEVPLSAILICNDEQIVAVGSVSVSYTEEKCQFQFELRIQDQPDIRLCLIKAMTLKDQQLKTEVQYLGRRDNGDFSLLRVNHDGEMVFSDGSKSGFGAREKWAEIELWYCILRCLGYKPDENDKGQMEYGEKIVRFILCVRNNWAAPPIPPAVIRHCGRKHLLGNKGDLPNYLVDCIQECDWSLPEGGGFDRH